MVARPGPLIPLFARAADAISVHYEADPHPQRLLAEIRELGCRAGLAVNRGTPPALVEELVEDLDYVNCMADQPRASPARRSSRPRWTSSARCGALLPERVGLEVDGGIEPETLPGLPRRRRQPLRLGHRDLRRAGPGRGLRPAGRPGGR